MQKSWNPIYFTCILFCFNAMVSFILLTFLSWFFISDIITNIYVFFFSLKIKYLNFLNQIYYNIIFFQLINITNKFIHRKNI